MEVIEEQLRDSNGMSGAWQFAWLFRGCFWSCADALVFPRCEYAIYVKALIKRQEGQARDPDRSSILKHPEATVWNRSNMSCVDAFENVFDDFAGTSFLLRLGSWLTYSSTPKAVDMRDLRSKKYNALPLWSLARFRNHCSYSKLPPASVHWTSTISSRP